MGIEIESIDVAGQWSFRSLAFLVRHSFLAAPANTSSESGLEVLDRLTRYCIDHLLVKARIRFGGIQSGGDQQTRIVEINGFVEALVFAVVIDDCDSFADGSGDEFFVFDPERHLVAEELSVAWIECVALQRACVGRWDVDRVREQAGLSSCGARGFGACGF